MTPTLYITSTKAQSGKSAIALNVMRLILGTVQRPIFFRPIVTSSDPQKPDHDIHLLNTHFHLNVPYQETYALSLEEARALINRGESGVLMDIILRAHKELSTKYDFILCEGTDFLGV